jgi:hypothetical protein
MAEEEDYTAMLNVQDTKDDPEEAEEEEGWEGVTEE